VAHVTILPPAALGLLEGFVVCHAMLSSEGGTLKEFNRGQARVNAERDSFRLLKYSF
jgi:hypothetical protein